VILCRAEYGRWSTGRYAKDYGARGFAFVAVDNRQWDKGRHAVWQEKESSRHEIEDGHDVVEWIVRQPWCNGRIGTVGGSGNAFASAMMIWGNIPHFTVNAAGNTAGNTKYYWCFHNGVRRGTSYRWIGTRGAPISGPVPTLPKTAYDVDQWRAFLDKRGRDCRTWYFNDTGWFDPMSQGAIDSFAALQHTGRAFVTVGPRGHGGVSGLPSGVKEFPRREPDKRPKWAPSLEEILEGKEPDDTRSTLKYYVMGDLTDADAPGNCYMYTHVWPVAHEHAAWYLHRDGTLSRTKPTVQGSSLAYDYDPADPAPTIGGHHSWVGTQNGPWDQRKLRKREDVLYFVSEPLEAPLAITGNLFMHLFFSSDAPDTAFVVKLIDIYPDGFEFLVRESAGMGRYWSGYSAASPVEAGKNYGLKLDMWSTAIVFNRGHRIGVIVTSSSDKAYEIHPNTYRQVKSTTEGSVARNTVLLSQDYASHILLPVVKLPDSR
jgi:putative CocE/NonD family hydrolase